MKNRAQCVGIILDGNRRWAKAHGLPAFAGHERGFRRVKDALQWCDEAGISHLVVYAFSIENWQRAKEEVSYLMDLFRLFLSKEVKHLAAEGFRVRCVGDRGRLPEGIVKLIEAAESGTRSGARATLVVAISYGGRAEILGGIRAVLANPPTELTEAAFSQRIWSAGIPDPDIIIRTGGEKRLSGFLTWESVYSELFFTDTYWPDFSKEEFQGILSEFSGRERRMGK